MNQEIEAKWPEFINKKKKKEHQQLNRLCGTDRSIHSNANKVCMNESSVIKLNESDA